jgi:hypothetical protein
MLVMSQSPSSASTSPGMQISAEESPDGFLDTTQNRGRRRPGMHSPQIDSICCLGRELYFYPHPAGTQDGLRVPKPSVEALQNHQNLPKTVHHGNRKVEQVACKVNRQAGPYHTFVSAFDMRNPLDALWHKESPHSLEASLKLKLPASSLRKITFGNFAYSDLLAGA